MARSKDEPGKGGFWRLDLERLEESRRSKRRSSLTVRVPRNRPPQENSKPPPSTQPTTTTVRKTKRYRPSPHNRGERKHNILSNISIFCDGETEDDENDNKKGKRDDEGEERRIVVMENEEEKTVETIETITSMPNQNVIIEPVNQIGIGEDELTGLLLASGGWDECQLELLDSLLDSL